MEKGGGQVQNQTECPPCCRCPIDGKHIAMKKPKKTGSDYYNYKGFLSLVLLALVDTEIPAPEPLEEAGPYLHYFLLGDDTFALMIWMVKPYSRKQLTREERIANYRISRGRGVVENTFGILVSRFRVLLGIMEQRQRVVRDIVFMCVVLHNMLRTHQSGADRV